MEDFYDEKLDKGSYHKHYALAIEAVEEGRLGKQELLWDKVKAVDIMKADIKAHLETGGPFMVYRDQENRMNSNKHIDIIYSSNLCIEIVQNQSITFTEIIETKDGEFITIKNSGDFVVYRVPVT